MKKYFDWGKTDLWGFMRFLDTMKIHGIIENDCEDFISSWCAKVNSVEHHKNKPLDFCAPTRNEILVVIFDDSVYLHGVVETNEAPELSFDLFRILFRAIIISTMRNYLSKNSHTHPMKTDQTKIHARHFMWCRCMLWCSVVFSFYLMTVFFFREIIPNCGDDDSTKKYPE